MGRLLLAGVGIVLGLLTATTAALGADAPERRLPLPRTVATYVPFFTWNGAYVGINAGYGFGSSQWTDTVTQASTNKFSTSGGLIGGTVGYNLQLSTVVVGVEGDIGWSGIKGSTTTNCITTCETSVGWLGTARGRIGYAFDRFLPYFTAGAAFGEVKGSVLGFGSFSQTQVGWTIGGGLEYAFLNNWSAKVEYLYVDLGDAGCNATCSGGNPLNVTFTTNILRGGVNYKF
jgi:outer membrane immunogenic protein